MLLQLPTDDLYELVGQYADEQMTVNAYFFVMIDRAQTQFGFEAAEHGFKVSEHDIGAP